MAAIIPNREGDVRRSKNYPVAASQTIRKGDPITIAAGYVSVGAIGATSILGFAAHDYITGASPDVNKDRLLVELADGVQEFKGTLKLATANAYALAGTTAGFIDEAGEMRIDTAATVKQLYLLEVAEPVNLTVGSPRHILFFVLNANRVIT